MGREVRRVPTNFEWPLNQTWWGYLLPFVPCQLCNGTGKASKPGIVWYWKEEDFESEYCPVCEGEGRKCPKIEVPRGPAYQMWETCSEGSPISPPFETQEELAHWLADSGASSFGSRRASYEQWLQMIQAEWAPSAVFTPETGLVSGVEGIASKS